MPEQIGDRLDFTQFEPGTTSPDARLPHRQVRRVRQAWSGLARRGRHDLLYALRHRGRQLPCLDRGRGVRGGSASGLAHATGL
jgi:hypothetical protein